MELLTQNADLSGQEFLDKLIVDLTAFAGSDEFGDDVSAVLFDFVGHKRNLD